MTRTGTTWSHSCGAPKAGASFLQVPVFLGRPPSLCVCVCVCIHTYIHTYVHTYTHTYIHTYTYIYSCMHTCIHTYIYTYISSFVLLLIHIYSQNSAFTLGFLLCSTQLALGVAPPKSVPTSWTVSSAERCEELLEATRADEELLGGRSHRVISDEELLGGRDYIYIYIY